MSEHESKRPTAPEVRTYWQGIAEDAAVLWHETTYPSGMIETVGPGGLVVYGPVTWKKLQAVALSKLTTMRPGFPEFEGADPPDAATLARRWNSAANVGKREDIRRMIEEKEYRENYTATFEPRQLDESTTDFYTRVSEYYRMRTALTGRPTQDLATAAEVPRTTAARWVREARVRGYLPATSKGRTSS